MSLVSFLERDAIFSHFRRSLPKKGVDSSGGVCLVCLAHSQTTLPTTHHLPNLLYLPTYYYLLSLRLNHTHADMSRKHDVTLRLEAPSLFHSHQTPTSKSLKLTNGGLFTCASNIALAFTFNCTSMKRENESTPTINSVPETSPFKLLLKIIYFFHFFSKYALSTLTALLVIAFEKIH